MKKKVEKTQAVINRRAKFDYELGDELVVGIVLNGAETRSARDGHVQLKGSFVTIKNNELWLNNASFSLRLNQKGGQERTVDTSPRKLLATRKQINQLSTQRIKGFTIVPTKMLTNGQYIKVVIALGKGKKHYDKREVIKRREQEREIGRIVKKG